MTNRKKTVTTTTTTTMIIYLLLNKKQPVQTVKRPRRIVFFSCQDIVSMPAARLGGTLFFFDPSVTT